ncbi:MAG: hypothetical protein ACRC1T_05425 [Clostridium chrysemydis]|uniref:beta barrel domain-containing protein n=1 Tax=Clostridium chrysemydis TaxID=2665504 RepID=UPI003F40AA3D
MDRKLNLKKGDKCIMAIVEMSNASRRVNMRLENIKEWTWEVEVVSVGRKYITVKRNSYEYKFDMENNYYEKSIYSPDYILYQNIKEIYEEKEAEAINDYIGSKIGQYGKPRLSLDKLKRIKNIIDEN